MPSTISMDQSTLPEKEMPLMRAMVCGRTIPPDIEIV
jgi:hypothetical protein